MSRRWLQSQALLPITATRCIHSVDCIQLYSLHSDVLTATTDTGCITRCWQNCNALITIVQQVDILSTPVPVSLQQYSCIVSKKAFIQSDSSGWVHRLYGRSAHVCEYLYCQLRHRSHVPRLLDWSLRVPYTLCMREGWWCMIEHSLDPCC